MRYFIPSIFIMLLIYFFSAMPSDESSLQHSRLIALFAYFGVDLFQILGKDTVFWVRKTAHFVIFGTLSVTYFYGFYKNQFQSSFKLAFLFSFFYAVTDEFHQYFVPGRAAHWKDVLIDILGALFFLTAMKIIMFLNSRKKK